MDENRGRIREGFGRDGGSKVGRCERRVGRRHDGGRRVGGWRERRRRMWVVCEVGARRA